MPSLPVGMAITKKSTDSKCWRGCGEQGTRLHCWSEHKLVQPLWKTARRFLIKQRVATRACSVMSDSLRPHVPTPPQPHLSPWNFPRKSTGVGCHFLLQGIFPTQGANQCFLHLLHWQAISLPLSHLGSPHDPAFPLLGVCLDKILIKICHANIHSSTFYKSQDMEAT